MRNIDKLFKDYDNCISLVCVGKSYRGKSYFLKYFLMDRIWHGDLKFGLVFTSTKFNKTYNFLDDMGIKYKIVEGYDEELLEKYFNNLIKIYEEKDYIEPSFVVFDDIMGCLNNSSKFFTRFMTTMRHLNINAFFAVQYLKGKSAISPTMRQQTTHALMWKSLTKDTTEALFESYGQRFNSLKEFKEYFENATEQKHSAMLYIENEDDMDKNYLTIKAPKYE